MNKVFNSGFQYKITITFKAYIEIDYWYFKIMIDPTHCS